VFLELPRMVRLQNQGNRNHSLISIGARGFGGRHAPMMSPRQLKEVIQVAHINVGSIAPRGALVGGGVLR